MSGCMWSQGNFIYDCQAHSVFPFYNFFFYQGACSQSQIIQMAFNFSLISVMCVAIDVSHFDIFGTAGFPEGERKRNFYKYCDLEIKMPLHFPAPDFTMCWLEIQEKAEAMKLDFILAQELD